MSDTDNFSCDTHGVAQPTFVCRHLVKGQSRQWYSPPPLPDDPWPDAWCDACHVHFEAEGDWNEASTKAVGGSQNIMVICQRCYEECRAQCVVHDDWCE